MAQSEADIEQRGRIPQSREELKRVAAAMRAASRPLMEDTAKVEYPVTDEIEDSLDTDEPYEEEDRGDGTFPIKSKTREEKDQEDEHRRTALAEARSHLNRQ